MGGSSHGGCEVEVWVCREKMAVRAAILAVGRRSSSPAHVWAHFHGKARWYSASNRTQATEKTRNWPWSFFLLLFGCFGCFNWAVALVVLADCCVCCGGLGGSRVKIAYLT